MLDRATLFPIAWAALFVVTIAVFSCDQDTTTGCSDRGKPQHYDRDAKEWTCKDKGRR